MIVFAGVWGVEPAKSSWAIAGMPRSTHRNAEDISDAYAEHRLVQEPNGGYLANAKACQDSCKVAPHCKKFTFKTGSNPPGTWGWGLEMVGGEGPKDAGSDILLKGLAKVG